MKIKNNTIHKLANMTPPIWHKDAIESFGDKLAEPLTLITSPTWQAFTQHHTPIWQAEHITSIKQYTAPTPPPVINFSKKDLIDYAEKSSEYFQHYTCTSHLYALKSFTGLHVKQRKFTMGGIWSVF